MDKNQENFVEWETLEYAHRQKSKDWFWAVGVLGGAIALVSIFVGNLLFAIFVGLATFSLMMYGSRKPEKILIAISTKGIHMGNEFFPYQTLDSFWIHEEENGALLTILSKERNILPHITFEVHPDIDPEALRDLLLDYVDEEFQPLSLTESVFSYLGF